MDGDRERWNARWRERAGELETASWFLAEHASLLPARGKVLDLAAGAGRNTVHLLRRGLDVTAVDVSDVALDKTEQRARKAGLDARLRLLRLDLEDPLALAPTYDVVVVAHYLDRARRASFVDLLHDGGLLLVINATVTNLERHARPSRAHLVEPGEQRSWILDRGMEIVVEHEDWNPDGVHEAAVLARKRPRVAADPIPDEPGPTSGPYR